jgi:hypothetical protein
VCRPPKFTGFRIVLNKHIVTSEFSPTHQVLKQQQEDLQRLRSSSSFKTSATRPPRFKKLEPVFGTVIDLRRQSTSSVFPSLFSYYMPIDSGLNALLSVLALSDAMKAAVSKGLPTCEDLQDVFLTLAADKTEVEAMLRKIVDETIMSDIDIRRIMFVFDWFMMNIVDPNFVWSNFTRSVYVAEKRARALLNHAPSVSTPVSQSTASAVSTIDFSSDVLAADAQRQATPAVPGAAATLKPHKLWMSPFAANTRKGNTRQLRSTHLVLASSLAFDVIEFYRKLVAASKTADIDLISFTSFDPACALWPSNRCAEPIF